MYLEGDVTVQQRARMSAAHVGSGQAFFRVVELLLRKKINGLRGTPCEEESAENQAACLRGTRLDPPEVDTTSL